MKTFRPHMHTLACLSAALLFPTAAHANKDRGDAPASYGTLAKDDGPVHSIQPSIHLGAVPPDAELDGQPDPYAFGDDQTGADDEDSVDPASLVFFEGTAPAITVQAFNNTGGLAKLGVWVDWNLDGVFKTDAAEFASVDVPSKPDLQTLQIALPPVPTGVVGGDPSGKISFIRLRITTDHAALGSPGGAALDGEVEDWHIQVFENLDFGDLSDTGPSTGPGDYQTTLANDGPSHHLGMPLRLGATVDAEVGSQHSADALGDDNIGIDDEDGVTIPLLVPGESATFLVNASNATTRKAVVWAYVDFNGDGDFNDPGEARSVTVPAGTVSQDYPVVFQVPFHIPHGRSVGARFRISTDADFVLNGSPYGSLPDGEVEDYLVRIAGLDFGDLPDTASGTGPGNYRTLFANDGPRHVIVPEVYFGVDPDSNPLDAEPDGQPNSTATGDDQDGNDDEDLLVALASQTASLAEGYLTGEVTLALFFDEFNFTSRPAWRRIWMDHTGSGNLAEVNAASFLASQSGEKTVFVTLPLEELQPGPNRVFTRMRLSTDHNAITTPHGPAPDGEVMDHLTSFSLVLGNGVTSTGSLPDPGPGTGAGDYQTSLENGGPSHWRHNGLYLGDQPPGSALAPNASGVLLPATFARSESLSASITATNQSGSAGWLHAFFDWNADGDFNDAGEALTPIPIPDGTADGSFPVSFTVPADAAESTPLGARFRVSQDVTLGANGHGGYGEIEDFLIVVKPLDFGDLPDTGPGTGPGNYRTLRADDGPRHAITSDLFIRRALGGGPAIEIDAEPDGQPTVDAQGDDRNGISDEGANQLSFNVNFLPDSGTIDIGVQAEVINETGSAAHYHAFFDIDNDGAFNSPGETAAPQIVPSSPDPLPIATLITGIPLAEHGPGLWPVYVRLRVSTVENPGPDGFGGEGEVEDHYFPFPLYGEPFFQDEWISTGSLPDLTPGTGPGDYQTELGNGGPGHWVGPIHLDITPPPVFARSETATIGVEATNEFGADGWIYCFIDWNNDGDFDDAGEALAPIPIAAGTVSGNFSYDLTVPADAVESTPLGARFRISNQAGLGANGPGGYGEVEDFLMVVSQLDFGDLPDTGPGTGTGNYQTLRSNNGPRHAIRSGLVFGAWSNPLAQAIDAELDGQPSNDARGDDDDGNNDEDLQVQLKNSQASMLAGYLTGNVNLDFTLDETNNTGQPAWRRIWIDHTGSGNLLEANAAAFLPAESGLKTITIGLAMQELRPGPNRIFSRMRLSTDNAAIATPLGFAPDGEVMDHLFEFQLNAPEEFFSMGSLPDLSPGTGPGDYQTALANDGPSHWRHNGLFLGDEPPGSLVAPNEPGITFPPVMRRGELATVRVRATNLSGRPAEVRVFIDWNGDGDFDDLNESSGSFLPTGSSDIELSFDFMVPPTAVRLTDIGARVRISDRTGLSANGFAGYGEVEDALIRVNLSPTELYQVWAQMNILDPGQRGQVDDPDYDGIPNLHEYAFLTDPATPDAPPVGIRVETYEFKGETFFRLLFPRRRDHVEAGLLYTPYLSNDFPVIPGIEIFEEAPLPVDADLEEASYRAVAPRNGLEPGFGTVGVRLGP